MSSTPYHLPSDAVWFITGCSSAIGKALSQLIASKGGGQRLVSTARQLPALNYLPDDHPAILKQALDVTSQASVDAAVAAALRRFGRLDVVVNNAENASDADARRCVETDFWGHGKGFQARGEDLEGGESQDRPAGGCGHECQLDGEGRIAFPGNAFYHASKFALEGFTEALSKEVRPEWNIHFSLIEPGGVQTNYATTGTRTIPVHPAYAAEDTPARVLERYISNEENRGRWAEADDVAAAMYRVADAGGKEMPLRVPLGPDAWGMMKAEFGRMERELEAVRPVSDSVGQKGQLESIEFLTTLDQIDMSC